MGKYLVIAALAVVGLFIFVFGGGKAVWLAMRSCRLN